MKTTFAALLAAFSMTACTGTETGNGFTQEIRVGAHSSSPADFAIGAPAGGGVVTEAWVIIGSMALVADGDCDDGGAAVEMPALGADDHAAGRVDLTVEMDAGDFCQLTLPVGGPAAIPTSAPPQLGPDNGIVIIGETAANTAFTIIAGAPDLALRGGASFALDDDTGDLFLGFDVASWLSGLDIDGGQLVGGQVLIDGQNNATLSAAFDANLAGGTELYTDANGNGEIDPGDQPIAAGQ